VQLELDGALTVIVEAPKPTDRAHAARTASWFTSVTSTPCSSARKARDARVARAPADHPFGERQCALEDLGGHRGRSRKRSPTSIPSSGAASW